MKGLAGPLPARFGMALLDGRGDRPAAGSRVWHLVAWGLYGVLALVVMWPVLPAWNEAFVGPTFGASQMWQMEQVWGALLSGRLPPFETTLLSYPDPGAVIFVGWPFMTVGFVFRLFMGTVAAVNCTLVLFLAAGGYTMFLLARRISGHVPGSLLAGAVYGFSTYAVSAVANGHIYSMFVLWLPLLLWSYDRWLATGTLRSLAAWTALVLLAFSESPYRLVEGVPLLGMWTVHFLYRNRAAPTLSWARVGVAAVASVVAVAGPFAYFGQQVDRAGSERLYEPMHAGELDCTPPDHPVIEVATDAGLITEGWLDPVTLFRPGALYDGSISSDVYNAHHVLYLGMLLPLLLAAFLVIRPGARRLLLWTMAVGGIMALGPAFHWGGAAVCVGGTPLLAPMGVLLKVFPPLGAMGAYYRFFLSVVAAGALALALAWPVLVQRLVGRGMWAVTAGALVVLTADALLVSPLRVPVPVVAWQPPTALTELSRAAGDRGVLVVPDIERESLRDGEERLCGFLWQMHADKPMTFKVPEACAAPELLNLSKPHEMPRYATVPNRDSCRGVLADRGIDWVLYIADNARAPGQNERASATLRDWFGEPVFSGSGGETKVYQVK